MIRILLTFLIAAMLPSTALARTGPPVPCPDDAARVIWDDVTLQQGDSLAPLACVEQIHGELKLDGLDTVSLAPLRRLRSVGNLTILRASGLEDLADLEGLAVGGSLLLMDNPHLAEVRLPSTTGLTELTVVRCAALQRIALPNLRGTLDLVLKHLPALTDLALPRLAVASSITLSDTGLADLSALSRLEGVSTLQLDHNRALTTLKGPPHALEVTESLILQDNPALLDLDGLPVVLGELTVVAPPTGMDWTGLVRATSTMTALSVLRADAPVDLAGLQGLQSLSGSLTLYGLRGGADLTGLSNLVSLGGLRLEAISDVTGVEALASLRLVEGDLMLDDVRALTDLAALSGLTRVGGKLELTDLPALVDLQGLEALESLGSLRINGCEALATLRGLEDLVHVAGDLAFTRTPALVNLSALNRLSRVDGELALVNTSLVTLEGLDALQHLGALVVRDNPALTDIRGFAELRMVAGDLRIHENPLLASVRGFGRVAFVGGDLMLSLNGADPGRGFRRLEQVDGTLTLIDGPVYLPALSVVHGGLTLAGDVAWSRTGLHALRHVDGDLTVRASGLVDLAGLASLEGAGQLWIADNPSLEHLDLPSLHHVEGLTVADNPALTSVVPLARLEGGTAVFVLSRCPADPLALVPVLEGEARFFGPDGPCVLPSAP